MERPGLCKYLETLETLENSSTFLNCGFQCVGTLAIHSTVLATAKCQGSPATPPTTAYDYLLLPTTAYDGILRSTTTYYYLLLPATTYYYTVSHTTEHRMSSNINVCDMCVCPFRN